MLFRSLGPVEVAGKLDLKARRARRPAYPCSQCYASPGMVWIICTVAGDVGATPSSGVERIAERDRVAVMQHIGVRIYVIRGICMVCCICYVNSICGGRVMAGIAGGKGMPGMAVGFGLVLGI